MFNNLNITSIFFAVPSPPSDLEVTIRTADALTVTWTATESEMFTGYKVTVGEGENVKTETPAKDVTSVEFTGLTAGTEYTVTLVSRNNEDESSALTDTASTREFRFI